MLHKYTEVLKLILVFDLELLNSGFSDDYWFNINYENKQDKILHFLASIELSCYEITIYPYLCQVDLKYRVKGDELEKG